ncbi:unnamed protein product [Ambrosiozyma monospora]|uniref:Unnamed protein product n=1 Tax=Ambrosiozyma monospora TaxID=43982 RepID=A0ACB5TEE7_AMBMO|nr:unnamed protein product [Ambrosiozyma monospora]
MLLTHLNFKNHVREYITDYEDELHMPGENHESTLDIFKKFKFKTGLDKYEVWINKPTDNWLKLFNGDSGEMIFKAGLKESELLNFHPYAANGTAKSEFVFANYGTISDFKALADEDVDVKSKIIIAREGQIHSSLKIKNAEHAGALAVLLYHDPYDDGEITEANGYKAYPDGPARSPFSINKETANFVVEQPGDPTTPGWSSTLFSRRIKPETVPKIPSISLSYADVAPILQHLSSGPDMGWKGNVEGFGYLPGPSTGFILDFGNLVQYKIKPIYNVVNEITGVMRDEEVIVGASRDIIGGIGGANLGHHALMELARGFNELVKLVL